MTVQMNNGLKNRSRGNTGKRWVIGVFLMVALVGGAVALWVEVLEDRFVPKRWGIVEPGYIYRSGQLSSALVKDVLEQHEIKVVVDLTRYSSKNPDAKAESEAISELGIEGHRYRLRGDGTGNIEHYAQAIKAINDARQAGKPVLVHCVSGAQRTGGVVASYRMLVEGKPATEAYAELPRYGWKPQDWKVIDYVNKHIAQLAHRLVEMKVIDQVPDPLPVLGPEQ